MQKGNDVIGKAIVAYDTGKRCDRVLDIVFDQNTNHVLGFLVDQGGAFHSGRVLPWEGVRAIGPNAIIVESKRAIVKTKQSPRIDEILKHDLVLRGTKVMTTDGRDLGSIVDLYFNEVTGIIEGYEASGGLFADAYSGRSFIPAPHTLNIGEDVTFVPPETADLMAEQVGGLKGAMQTAGSRIQESTAIASQRLQESTSIASQRLQEAAQSASTQLQQTTTNTNQRLQDVAHLANEQFEQGNRSVATALLNSLVSPAEQADYAIDKTVQRSVLTPTGEPLVEAGTNVTRAIVERAQQLGVLSDVYRATGGDPAFVVGQRLRESTNLAQQRLHMATRSATASLTNRLIAPEQQKEFVVGKTAEQEVFDYNDVVLISKGEVVTPAIADTAELAGVLDQLYLATGGQVTADLGQRFQNAIAQGTTAITRPLLEQAKGRRVQRLVRDEEGHIIVAPGQIVTDLEIDRARQHHREVALLEAVALSSAVLAHSNASDAMNDRFGDVNTRLREQAALAQTNANTAWEELKAQFQAWRERSAKAMYRSRIERALGRPVTRVILDKDDRVILNVGELITHEAIDQARSAEVLNILLNSVYRHPPDIQEPELRARDRGTAALNYHPSNGRSLPSAPNREERISN